MGTKDSIQWFFTSAAQSVITDASRPLRYNKKVAAQGQQLTQLA